MALGVAELALAISTGFGAAPHPVDAVDKNLRRGFVLAEANEDLVIRCGQAHCAGLWSVAMYAPDTFRQSGRNNCSSMKTDSIAVGCDH